MPRLLDTWLWIIFQSNLFMLLLYVSFEVLGVIAVPLYVV